MSNSVQLSPSGFFSYVHLDDAADDGRISDLRRRLELEVQVQTGAPFTIFQDRSSIGWGQNWRKRIKESLNDVTFLIPVITPSYFTSGECRSELGQFLERQQLLERDDLILPIYYVECPQANAKMEGASFDELVEKVFQHNYANWLEWRYEEFSSPDKRRALTSLAVDIRLALQRHVDLPISAGESG